MAIIPLTKDTMRTKIIDENNFWEPGQPSVFEFIEPMLTVLWKDWSANMELAAIGKDWFRLKGECPYASCRHLTTFQSITNTHFQEDSLGNQKLIAACKCAACHGYILGILGQLVTSEIIDGMPIEAEWVYQKHYPLQSPNDEVAAEVPPEIAGDFKEALRCQWIKAFKASVLMCRRALQVSCDRENAQGKDLFTQIDDLAANQRITAPLKKMAHRIRLLGKKGAHGDYSDIDDTITEQDADDAIRFMRHYLDHVYVFPAQLDKDVNT